mmetsp:Transcript_3845/g.5171  ORF Transcript_3845/g.5171 Transcript_3845/m.5171 type:complete len:287 (-) Transcript_3845:165-1025(-)|eukprot:CAMPEP_0185729846 /NCGR_PEP_ID=MMETSP1171-20130828/7522_1 /TAXON_ID=374046 /ORGANISM="Helicotheca tamensis, Strain CCMP826" /LENGTH=286 /DNA_ID=CAMNT_0028398777 /DNA_START=24 /DNA_END=884 /DNA_ORIENTATION=-
MILNALQAYLTGKFAFSGELQAFWMAFQGAMIVRGGANKDGSMAWFHAFMLSTMMSYAGGTFGPIWMGRATAMFTNDLNFAACIVAFILVNYLPFDLGFKIGNFFPVKIVTTLFAQLFRAMGLIKFCTVAFEALKESPSDYYPVPVFGPILFATFLGNFGGFFHKGFHGYLQNGMPWPFQNGFVCATFYHFFAHDKLGFLGVKLRYVIYLIPGIKGKLDDKTFATVVVSGFMHIMAILQLPEFLGPSFSPFTVMGRIISLIIPKPAPKVEEKKTKEKEIGTKDKDL